MSIGTLVAFFGCAYLYWRYRKKYMLVLLFAIGSSSVYQIVKDLMVIFRVTT
jgi:hypothetical protein